MAKILALSFLTLVVYFAANVLADVPELQLLGYIENKDGKARSTRAALYISAQIDSNYRAYQGCAQNGKKLLTIQDDLKNGEVRRLLNLEGVTSAWTCGEQYPKGRYSWSVSGNSIFYFNWKNSKTAPYLSPPGCVAVSSTPGFPNENTGLDYGWEELNCARTLRYICE